MGRELTDYAEYLPWRDNLNWFGLKWRRRWAIVKAIDEVYFRSALFLAWFPNLLGSWRGLYVMRARGYFEIIDEFEQTGIYPGQGE